jgi:hypothetical protein
MLSTLAFGQDVPAEESAFTLIVLALLAISEALTLLPKVKSNGIFQLIVNILKKIAGK